MNRLLLGSLLILIILGACQHHVQDVRQAATNYMHARLKQDFGRATLMVTPQSYPQIEELSLMSQEYPVLTDADLQFECLRVEIEGDSALVYYSVEPYLREEKLRLYRSNDQWLVQLAFHDVPDPMMLAQDLLQLEAEDTISALQKDLDRILFEEDSLLSDSSLLLSP